MKKPRRFTLSLAILLPLFALILASEVGLYFGAYGLLDSTISQNASRDDMEDLLTIDETLSNNDYALVGYAVCPIIKAYEDNKPVRPFTPGSAEETQYRTDLVKTINGQSYEGAKRVLDRMLTTFVALYYEDVTANRIVLVCASEDNPNYDARDTTRKTQLYIGAFFPRDASYDDGEYYGAIRNNPSYGKVFSSALYLSEVSHPTMPDTFGGPYRIWAARETSYNEVYAAIPAFTRGFAWFGVVVTLALFALAFIAVYVVVLHPAKRLSREGNAYVEALQQGKIETVFKQSDGRVHNEMTDLNDAFFYTQGAIAEYAEKVRTAASYEEKINAELSLAERIQTSMVPSSALTGERFVARGYMLAAKEVGGDLYDYFKIDKDRVGFFIGDVSGKGVPAALFMAKTQTLLRLLTAELDINKVNAMLCEGNKENLFATAFIGVLNYKTGKLRYVNCGHEPVFLSHDGVYTPLEAKPNLALGCLEDLEYEIEERTLSRGDRLFLYTDGVSEAMDKNGNLFGKQKIRDALNEVSSLSNEGIIQAMRIAIANFVGEAPQSDDICMMSLDYAKEAFIRFDANPEGMAKIQPFADEFLSNDDPVFLANIQILLDELCSNVVKYAKLEGRQIFLSLRDDGSAIYGTLVDTGKPFDPIHTEIQHDEDAPGGLGIVMVKAMSDRLDYQRIGEYNVLLFVKKR